MKVPLQATCASACRLHRVISGCMPPRSLLLHACVRHPCQQGAPQHFACRSATYRPVTTASLCSHACTTRGCAALASCCPSMQGRLHVASAQCVRRARMRSNEEPLVFQPGSNLCQRLARAPHTRGPVDQSACVLARCSALQYHCCASVLSRSRQAVTQSLHALSMRACVRVHACFPQAALFPQYARPALLDKAGVLQRGAFTSPTPLICPSNPDMRAWRMHSPTP